MSAAESMPISCVGLDNSSATAHLGRVELRKLMGQMMDISPANVASRLDKDIPVDAVLLDLIGAIKRKSFCGVFEITQRHR